MRKCEMLFVMALLKENAIYLLILRGKKFFFYCVYFIYNNNCIELVMHIFNIKKTMIYQRVKKEKQMTDCCRRNNLIGSDSI